MSTITTIFHLLEIDRLLLMILGQIATKKLPMIFNEYIDILLEKGKINFIFQFLNSEAEIDHDSFISKSETIDFPMSNYEATLPERFDYMKHNFHML